MLTCRTSPLTGCHHSCLTSQAQSPHSERECDAVTEEVQHFDVYIPTLCFRLSKAWSVVLSLSSLSRLTVEASHRTLPVPLPLSSPSLTEYSSSSADMASAVTAQVQSNPTSAPQLQRGIVKMVGEHTGHKCWSGGLANSLMLTGEEVIAKTWKVQIFHVRHAVCSLLVFL